MGSDLAMQTKEDIIANINKIEKRFKEAQRIQKYLEKENAPQIRITEIKRIVNFLEHEYNTRAFAFKVTELALNEKE